MTAVMGDQGTHCFQRGSNSYWPTRRKWLTVGVLSYYITSVKQMSENL